MVVLFERLHCLFAHICATCGEGLLAALLVEAFQPVASRDTKRDTVHAGLSEEADENGASHDGVHFKVERERGQGGIFCHEVGVSFLMRAMVSYAEFDECGVPIEADIIFELDD